MVIPLSLSYLNFVLMVLPVFISVALVTLLERKVLSIMGTRVGPNKVSFVGFLQPITDAIKLSYKQTCLLSNFSFVFFFLSACLMLGMSMYSWVIFFSSPVVVSLKYGVLALMFVLSVNSLNSIFCGWSSFSKYSLLGSMRTVAQLVSYESVLFLILLVLLCSISEFSLLSSKFFLLSMLVPFCFLIWIPSMLAELNRTPYDFSEGESELVSGFNTEFGSNSFTLIFLAEYSIILFFCSLTSFLFFFGSYIFFFSFSVFLILWCRAVLPRYRFDKLMSLAWKCFIPFLTIYFFSFLYFCF